MFQTVLEAGKHAQGASIHFECFAAAADTDYDPKAAFEVELESTGAVYTVSPDQTILGRVDELTQVWAFGFRRRI